MAARARRRPLLHAGLRDSAADARADAAVQLLEHRCRLVHARAAVAHPSRPRRPTARSRPCWRHRRERPPFCGVRGGGHHFDLFRAPLLARRHHQAARLVCREHGHVARERVGTRRLPVLARDVGTARLGWRRVVPAASSAVGVAGQRVPSDRRFGRLRLAAAPLPAPERRRGGRPAALQRARHRQEHGAGRGQRDRSEHERAVQPRTPDRVTRPCHPAGRGYAQGGARSRRAVGLVGQGAACAASGSHFAYSCAQPSSLAAFQVGLFFEVFPHASLDSLYLHVFDMLEPGTDQPVVLPEGLRSRLLSLDDVLSSLAPPAARRAPHPPRRHSRCV